MHKLLCIQNYFNMPSTPEMEDKEIADERASSNNKESSSKKDDENLKEDEEGNLSRSPSSVMLFGLVEGNA